MATRQKPSDILTMMMAVDGTRRRGHPTNPVGLPGQRQRDDALAADVDASSFQDSRSDATATRARRLARCTMRDAEPFRFVAFAERLAFDSPAHARQVLAPARMRCRGYSADVKFASMARWKSVSGQFETFYEVSDDGRVRSKPRTIQRKGKDGSTHSVNYKARSIKHRMSGSGYPTVELSKSGKRVSFMVHRLVLEAFVGRRPKGNECRHLNGDPEDNRLENLAWGTPKENSDDKHMHGTHGMGEQNSRAKLRAEQVIDIRECGGTNEETAKRFGVSTATISHIRTRRKWTHI